MMTKRYLLKMECISFFLNSSFNCINKFVVAQSCSNLCNPMDYSPPGSSLHGDSPGKNAGVAFYAPPQGDLPKPEIKPRTPALQAGSLPSELPGKPLDCLLMLYSVTCLNN